MADPQVKADLSARLEGWARDKGLGPLRISRLTRAEGGQSSDTWFVAGLDGTGAAFDWVLKVEPRARQVYQDPSVERQYRVIEGLAACDGLPIPAPVALETDPAVLGAPFFAMARAGGAAPPNAYHSEGLLAEATPAARERIWDEAVRLMAGLHAVDPAAFGFLAWEGGPAGDGVAQEIGRWQAFLEWSGIPRQPLYERAARWLDDHAPEPAGIGFAWGDARPCNMMFDATRCTAIIDWETASLGTAETDLGWWLSFDRMISDCVGLPRLDGVPDAAATIALWEAASGRRAQAMDWHILFATYRFAMIAERAGRLTFPDAPDRGAAQNPATRLLEALLDEQG